MNINIRLAEVEDIDVLESIETIALPECVPYVRSNEQYFFHDAPGRFFVAENDQGEIMGFGRYHIMPDNSGWLEAMRVAPEFQRQGIGKKLYSCFFDFAKETEAPFLTMYTEHFNERSKNLSGKMGFTLANTFGNKEVDLTNYDCNINDFNFKEVNDKEELSKIFLEIDPNWPGHISLNRTFYNINKENIEWMADNHMVFSDGENTIIMGARMLKERGLFLAYADGDYETCIKFAKCKAKELDSNKLTAIFPSSMDEYETALDKEDFKDVFELLVMENKNL